VPYSLDSGPDPKSRILHQAVRDAYPKEVAANMEKIEAALVYPTPCTYQPVPMYEIWRA